MRNRFGIGEFVRVKSIYRSGHIRTPGYVRGKTGQIRTIHGSFPNPEKRAYGGDGFPKVPLYGVSFELAELWNKNSKNMKMIVDIFEHWLEPSKCKEK